MIYQICAWRFLPIGILVFVSPANLVASDYLHSCKTPDGRFVIEDNILVPLTGKNREHRGKPLAYKVLRNQIQRHVKGFCTDKRFKRQQFSYEARSYTLTIRFQHNGILNVSKFSCEYVADGLPAALNCDRNVKMFNYTKTPKY